MKSESESPLAYLEQIIGPTLEQNLVQKIGTRFGRICDRENTIVSHTHIEKKKTFPSTLSPSHEQKDTQEKVYHEF